MEKLIPIDLTGVIEKVKAEGKTRRVLWQDSESIAFLSSGRKERWDFHIDPADEVTLQVTGVQEIDAAGDKLFRVHTAAATDPTEGIVALASTHHWGLRQIGPAQTSLEEVFVNLTQAEAQP